MSIFCVKVVHGNLVKNAHGQFSHETLYLSTKNVTNGEINLAGMAGQGPALPGLREMVRMREGADLTNKNTVYLKMLL